MITRILTAAFAAALFMIATPGTAAAVNLGARVTFGSPVRINSAFTMSPVRVAIHPAAPVMNPHHVAVRTSMKPAMHAEARTVRAPSHLHAGQK